MMISALSSKWTVDSLIDNAVTVKTGNKTLEFIQLADGNFNPPPGITSELVKNADNTYTVKERYEIELRFEPVPSDSTKWRISTWKDADANTMTFTYSSDKLQTIQDAFGRTLTLNYAGDSLNSVSDSTGRSVSYGYDAVTNDLITYTDPELKPWTYVYDDPNHPHRMTKLINSLPIPITTAINAYDSLGRVKTQTVPRRINGIDTTVTYNFYFSGYRNLEEDPDNKTLIYYFDNSGRLKEFVNALGNSTKYEYDGQNHQTKVTNPRNYFTTFEYDGNHNLTKIINALIKETNNTYDAQFRLTDTVDPLLHTTHFDYDTEHHLILTRDAVGNENRATYYTNGLPQTATDARLTVTTLTYDAYGNPYTTKVAAHPAVTTVYNSRGWLTSLTDQVNTTTNFPIYNNRGQLKLKTDPLLKTTQLFYDDAGRLDYVIDRNNNMIDYSYTPTSKIDTITYPDTSTVRFTYNQHDDLTQMQDSLGNTSYGYDFVHRLTSQTDANGFVVGYGYDEAGNVTSITYPGNKKVIYTYDELNRLKTVTNWLGQTATYNYDDAGRLISLTNFNNTVTYYSYDNANRLTSLENKKSDTTTILASYSFILDANGNRTQTVQNEPLTLTPNTDTVSYTYNTQKNRLLTAGANSFSYDDEGQLSTSVIVSLSNYTFDYEHRLKTIGSNIQFFYDGAGNRLKAVRNGVETRYIYDAGGNLIAEADGNNIITKYYIHGLGLMAMVTDTGQVYTYHYNAVGSTIAMSDSTQTIINKYAYDEFGNIAANSVENVPQPFKFVGQYGVMTEPNKKRKGTLPIFFDRRLFILTMN